MTSGKPAWHLVSNGSALCRVRLSESVRAAGSEEAVTCRNCLARMTGNWQPKHRGGRGKMAPPVITSDDLEATIWHVLSEMRVARGPWAAGYVSRIMLVAREWALACGAYEQQLGVRAPDWDDSDPCPVRPGRKKRAGAEITGFKADFDGHRECRGCRGWLPMVDFHKDSKRPGGHRTRCKECTSQAKKAAAQAA